MRESVILGMVLGFAGWIAVLSRSGFALPPNLPSPDTVISWLLVQALVCFLFAVWIFARTGSRAKHLFAKHPTLGNFTNLKYTFTRLITPIDFFILFFLNLAAMAALFVF